MTLSFTNQSLRNKLGNTIAANFSEDTLSKAVAYGVSKTCEFSFTVPDYWSDSNPYWGGAVGTAMEFATAFVRSTQVNVSIQMTREYAIAVQDAQGLRSSLISANLLNPGMSNFVTEEYTTDVLNPTTGTMVTGLHGIVRRNRLLDLRDWVYTP